MGDGNTAFFHKTIKARNSSNMVKQLKDENGNMVQDMEQIKDIAIAFYQKLLGHSNHCFSAKKAARVPNLIQKKFSPWCVARMGAVFTREEIRKVMFSLNGSKAPGPDGYSAGFYHKAWPMVGQCVEDAVFECFGSGKLLR